MIRSCALPIRSIAITATSSLCHLRFLGSSTVLAAPTKKAAKSDKQLSSKQLHNKTIEEYKNSLKQAKELKKDIQNEIKELEALHRKLIKERKFEEKAFRPFRALTIPQFYCKVYGRSLDGVRNDMKTIPEDQLEKLRIACEEYNEKCKSMLPPKPKGIGNSFTNFVSKNFPEGGNAILANKALVAQWKTMSESEKAQYDFDEAERLQNKQAIKDWKESRIHNYKKYLEFKNNYKYEN